MPSSSYHHGNLREALVDEAVAVAREHGPAGLGLRELARRVGVSHNAAYRHFAHRDDLVNEVAAHAMRELVAAMQRRLDAVVADDEVLRARRRLAALGRTYVEFALAEPGLFRVVFTHRSGRDTAEIFGEGPYELLGDVLDELVDVGFLSEAGRVGADATCWSAVHGFSVLNLDGPLAEASADERATTLGQVLTAIDRSYAATTGATIEPGDLSGQ